MSPEAYRRSRQLSQGQLALELGVASKGYISRLERSGEPWPLRLALRIEELSKGQIAAPAIVDPEDAQLLTSFADRAVARALAQPQGRA